MEEENLNNDQKNHENVFNFHYMIITDAETL